MKRNLSRGTKGHLTEDLFGRPSSVLRPEHSEDKQPPTSPACHCEDPESHEGDAAISPVDSDNILFYDGPMGEKKYFVYILTNLHNTTLYTGITNNLFRRVQQHKQGEGGQFSQKYKMRKLVYYEVHGDVRTAITREKEIKAGSRIKKVELISKLNPDWLDLTLEAEK